MKNENNYIISLGNLCKWMANYAENWALTFFQDLPQKKYFMTKMKKLLEFLVEKKELQKMVKNLICMSLKLL